MLRWSGTSINFAFLRNLHILCCFCYLKDAHVRLATFLTSEMSDIVEDDKLCNLQTTCTWMSRCPQVNDIFDIFARKIFQLSSGKGIGFFPFCHGIPTHIYPSLLSLADVLLINSSLPVELRNEWRFLFSSRIHGESFSRQYFKLLLLFTSHVLI